ncbi:MAG TPA: MFS transporter [Thermopolyspora sp.]
MIEDPPGAFAARYRALSVAMVALIILIAFEYLAVATAMPVVARELHGLALYGLAFSGPLATGVVATVLGGRWSDVKGPVAPLWTGLAAFTAGLLIAGAAWSMDVLIAGRALQGFGGGLFSVSIYVLVARMYPATLHPRVFSLLAAAWVVPSMIGPPITGVLVDGPGWRWVFFGIPLFAVPAAILLWRGLLGQDMAEEERTDPGGEPRSLVARVSWALVAAAGAAALQYGGGLTGWGGPALLAAGVALLAVALPRLLPKGTLRAARGLPTVVALRGLAAGAFFATEVFVPLMLVQERGLSPTQAGVALTGGALTWSLGSWIRGRRPGHRVLTLRLGTALIAAGVAVMALTVIHAVPVLVGFAAWAVSGLGIGLVYPTLSVLILKLSRPGEQGVNSSALQIGESIFSVVTIAVTGAMFVALGSSSVAYPLCLAVMVVIALTGTAIAGRFEQAPATGTMGGEA